MNIKRGEVTNYMFQWSPLGGEEDDDKEMIKMNLGIKSQNILIL